MHTHKKKHFQAALFLLRGIKEFQLLLEKFYNVKVLIGFHKDTVRTYLRKTTQQHLHSYGILLVWWRPYNAFLIKSIL